MDNNNNNQLFNLNNNNLNNTNIDNSLNNQEPISVIPTISTNSSNISIDKSDQINLNQNTNNKFFANNEENNTSLNSLNVDGAYNHLENANQYLEDPKVKENIAKKNTITITSNGKVFIIIVIILFIAIMFLPDIFDFFRNATYSD